jgi:hypothetical protein
MTGNFGYVLGAQSMASLLVETDKDIHSFMYVVLDWEELLKH